MESFLSLKEKVKNQKINQKSFKDTGDAKGPGECCLVTLKSINREKDVAFWIKKTKKCILYIEKKTIFLTEISNDLSLIHFST